MSQQSIAGSRANAWLLSRSGSMAGSRFPIPDGKTRIGRAPDNDVVVDGADSATVSLYHVEICRDDKSCHVRDLASTNGTWVNDQRIEETEIPPAAVIRLGSQGPEFAFVLEEAGRADLDRTIDVSTSPARIPADSSPVSAYEKLVSSAVMRARRMRRHGVSGQTMTIMRGMIEQALRRTNRRFRIVGYSLLAALLAVSSLAFWKITDQRREKRAIDTHIRQIDAELQKAGDGMDTNHLLSQLADYSKEGESLQKTLLYRLSVHNEGDFVTRELRSVMAEFGAEVYSIPSDFTDRVNYYIAQYQGPDRPIIARALNQAAGQIETIQRILKKEQLPADLAYIPVVESRLEGGQASSAGAVGPWQFTVATAKAYGLRVDREVDERKNLVKSTVATCKYLRDLILDFGAGSSVMLALAAYNSGSSTVKQAVSRNVRDPINQRNFWYLYRAQALPRETREYVPRVFAAILIGRNPQHFKF